MHKLNHYAARTTRNLYSTAAALAGVLLITSAALTLLQIVGRAMGLLISTGISLAGYCMVSFVFLAMPWTLRTGGHIRVDLFTRLLSDKNKTKAEIWCLSIGLASMGFLAYSIVKLTLRSYFFGSLSTGLMAVPLWIPQLFMSVGAVLTTIAFFEEICRVVTGHKPTYYKPEEG